MGGDIDENSPNANAFFSRENQASPDVIDWNYNREIVLLNLLPKSSSSLWTYNKTLQIGEYR